jgi:hypothetical protein
MKVISLENCDFIGMKNITNEIEILKQWLSVPEKKLLV